MFATFISGTTLTGPLSIAALHGLNGHAFNTWATKEGQIWLRDLLPNDIPNARILTYGYNSKISSNSFAGIDDFVQDFLAVLRDKRKDVGYVIIINLLQSPFLIMRKFEM